MLLKSNSSLEMSQQSDWSAIPSQAPSLQSDSAGDSERRRGLRIRQERPIKIYEPTSNRYIGGQTLDISATGLRIELPASTPVREGSPVHVHVGLNQQGQSLANRRQMMQARIVWVDRDWNIRHPRLTCGIELEPTIAAHLDAA